jgi:hypothetical protein
MKKIPENRFAFYGPDRCDLMFSLFDHKVIEISCDILGGQFHENIKVVFVGLNRVASDPDSYFGKILFCDPSYEEEERNFFYRPKYKSGYIKEKEEAPK